MGSITEIYRAGNEVEARLLVALLGDHGIQAHVVGEQIQNVAGEVPGQIAGPCIWTDEEQAAKARQLIVDSEASRKDVTPDTRPGWTCPKCDEEIEFGFDMCWKCRYNPSAC